MTNLQNTLDLNIQESVPMLNMNWKPSHLMLFLLIKMENARIQHNNLQRILNIFNSISMLHECRRVWKTYEESYIVYKDFLIDRICMCSSVNVYVYIVICFQFYWSIEIAIFTIICYLLIWINVSVWTCLIYTIIVDFSIVLCFSVFFISTKSSKVHLDCYIFTSHQLTKIQWKIMSKSLLLYLEILYR